MSTFVLYRLGIHALNLPSQNFKIWQPGNSSKLKISSKCWLPRYIQKETAIRMCIFQLAFQIKVAFVGGDMGLARKVLSSVYVLHAV